MIFFIQLKQYLLHFSGFKSAKSLSGDQTTWQFIISQIIWSLLFGGFSCALQFEAIRISCWAYMKGLVSFVTVKGVSMNGMLINFKIRCHRGRIICDLFSFCFVNYMTGQFGSDSVGTTFA